MKLKLITHSPQVETMIATSMLTTSTGEMPSTLFHRLKTDPDRVSNIVSRVEVQHGNILEHNRLIWSLEAKEEQVLDVLLRTKYLHFTQVGDKWLVSGNLRSIIELHRLKRTQLTEAILESISGVSPSIIDYIRRNENEG